MVKIDDEFVRKFGFNSVEEMMAAAAEKKRLSNIELKKKYGGPIEGTIPEDSFRRSERAKRIGRLRYCESNDEDDRDGDESKDSDDDDDYKDDESMAEEGESSRRQAGATGNDDVEESDEDSEEDSDEDDDESMDEDNMSDSPAKTEDPERMDTDDDRRNHSKK